MSIVKTGVGTQDIFLGLILGWGHHILFRIRGGTPHMKLCSDVHTGVGTPHKPRGGHRT